MPQFLNEVPLRFLDGHESRAVRSGSNAAWLCRCGRDLPLLGYSDVAESSNPASLVVCPQCERRFIVVAPATKGIVIKVSEVS